MLRGDPGRCRADANGRTTRPVVDGRRRDGDRKRDREGSKCGQKRRAALVTVLDGGNGGGVECCLHDHIIEMAALDSLRDR